MGWLRCIHALRARWGRSTMSVRHTIGVRQRDLLLLFVLGLIVNGAVAAVVAQPGYIDAYYYFNGGTFIAQGQWTEPYLWNYVAPPPMLPTPAFGYWQPLASMLAALGIR